MWHSYPRRGQAPGSDVLPFSLLSLRQPAACHPICNMALASQPDGKYYRQAEAILALARLLSYTGDGVMRQKIIRLTVASAVGAMAAASLGATGQAQTSTVAHVPCSASKLAAAMTSASSGGTLSLARGCGYVLTQALPVVTGTLNISGNGATLVRSYARVRRG